MQLIASLPESERVKFLAGLNDEDKLALLYDWKQWARPNQLPPLSDWYIWLILSGRGFGKTRIGAEMVRQWAYAGYTPIALIGQTKADVRDTMVEVGDSSILKVSPPWFMPEYEPSKRRLTWPNGVQGIIYSGDEPDQLRGPQHAKAWADELAKFKYPQDTWDNLMMGLRIGDNPQVVVTTTPRPIKIIKEMAKDKAAVVTAGHTMDNRLNLAPQFLKLISQKYEGTRIGRQELAGEILEDNPGALWNRDIIDSNRSASTPDLVRVVVGVDPPGGATECGIVVGGKDSNDHYYILDDRSLQDTPDKWAEAVLAGYNVNKADIIVGETNFGGDMVENTLRQAAQSRNISFRYKPVNASRGKAIRAEPIVALYEQGRVHHVGSFSQLEDEQCEWEPGITQSPNRLDALVWCITELSGLYHNPLHIG